MKRRTFTFRFGVMVLVLASVLFASEAFAVSGNITQINFTTDPQTIDLNTVSGVLTIQTQNSENEDEKISGGPQTINLSSTSGTGEFSSNSETWIPVTSLTMNSGTANRSFYYKDSTSGTHTLTVTALGQTWTEATQAITINAAPEAPVLGCTDSDANNYDPEATEDDGSCTYDPVAPVLPDECPAGEYNLIEVGDNNTEEVEGTLGNDFIVVGNNNSAEIKGRGGNDCIVVGDDNSGEILGGYGNNEEDQDDGDDVIIVGENNTGEVKGGDGDDSCYVDGDLEEVDCENVNGETPPGDTEEELCEEAGGTWNFETEECEMPVPPELCTDEEANNTGEVLPCTYDDGGSGGGGGDDDDDGDDGDDTGDDAGDDDQSSVGQSTRTSGSRPLTSGSLGEVLGAENFQFTQYMKRGLRDGEVLELQKRLQSMSLYWGKLDGIFGILTEAAVKAYQMANPSLKVDGIVGPLTRAVLNK